MANIIEKPTSNMEKGKLYKHKNTDLIVKCLNDTDVNDTFCGYVYRGYGIHKDSHIKNDWISWMFEEYIESATSIQIGGDHYKDKAIQPIDYIIANKMDFCSGNVIKYITRFKEKNGVEDLKKAKHYIDFLINQYENEKSI